MTNVIEEFPLIVALVVSSWVSYLAGLDIFMSAKQLYLRSQLYKMKKTMHRMFKRVEETPNHSQHLENMFQENENDISKEIARQDRAIAYVTKEALLYVSLAGSCAALVAYLF